MNEMTPARLGITVRLATDFDSAVDRVTEALKAEGFGVLTEIDVKATLKKKLDVDFRSYKILGACNPPLAYQALSKAPEVGLLLPCNVIVQQVEEGLAEVSFIDPMTMLGVITIADLRPVAEEALARIERAAASLRG